MREYSGHDNPSELDELVSAIGQLSNRLITEGSPPAFAEEPPQAPPVRGRTNNARYIASLREKLERARREGRDDEIVRTLVEVSALFPAAREALSARHAAPAAAPGGSRRLSPAAIAFLVANAILATAAVTSIAWYLAYSSQTIQQSKPENLRAPGLRYEAPAAPVNQNFRPNPPETDLAAPLRRRQAVP